MITSAYPVLRAALARTLLAVLTAFCLVCLSGLVSPAVASAQSAAEPKYSFDVPAGDAKPMLRQFAAQAKREIVFSIEAVDGIRTKAVKGEMTAQEAADLMLADTGLVAAKDKTGAFAVRKVREAESKNGERVIAQDLRSGRPENTSRVQTDGTLVLDTYEVTGSRLRSSLELATIQSVISLSRDDLDRLGVTSIEGLQTYIPQLPTYDWSTQSINGSSGHARLNFGNGLRGIGNTATLVLINGRRANKLGQNQSGVEGYDLNGVPFSAIERIEILTDGASAIYGADALAGVINIILKKHYSGTELRVTYDNTFDTDVAYTSAQLFHGLRRDHFSMNVALNWSKTNSLSLRDRSFSASRDRRPFGGGNGLASVPLGGPGVVRSTSGANLPGLNTNVAAIPATSTGVSLTIADFANAGPVPAPFDYNQYYLAGRQRSHGARIGLEFEARTWLNLFIDSSWNRSETFTNGAFPTVGGPFSFQQFVLPAGYVGNPFGVPILLERVLWELNSLTKVDYRVETNNVLLGARGTFPNGWRYEVGVQRQSTEYATNGFSFFNASALRSAVNSANPASRPILLNNGILNSPNAPDLWTRIGALSANNPVGEQPALWTYDFKADGPLWTLPGGEVKAAFGIEAREEYAHFTTGAVPNYKRTAVGYFGEVQLPLIGPDRKVPGIRKLGLNLSARSDSYSDFGSKTIPRVGLLLAPVEKLVLRAGVGRGYKVPTLFEFYSPTFEDSFAGIFDPVTFADILDPLRGNEPVAGTLPVRRGGNSDLRPETSTSYTLGTVVGELSGEGFSMSIDYYDVENLNRVVDPDYPTLINYFNERVIRATPTAADSARGFAGSVIGFDARYLNVAVFRVTGFDTELRYRKTLKGENQLTIRLAATIPQSSEIVAKPVSAPFDNKPGQPWRGTGAISLVRGSFEIGSVVTYTSAHRFYYSPSFEGIEARPVTLLDIYASYSFANAEYNSSLRRLLAGTKLRVGIYNVLEKTPQIGPETGGQPLGSVDPRGRRYQLLLTKQF